MWSQGLISYHSHVAVGSKEFSCALVLQDDSPPQFYQACQFRLFKGRCLETLPKDL